MRTPYKTSMGNPYTLTYESALSAIANEFEDMGYDDSREHALWYARKIREGISKKRPINRITNDVLDAFFSKYRNFVDIIDSKEFTDYAKKKGLRPEDFMNRCFNKADNVCDPFVHMKDGKEDEQAGLMPCIVHTNVHQI